MRFHSLVLCCSAVALPQLASAQVPFSNDALGKLERTLSYCAEVNPNAASEYQELSKRLLQGVPEKDLSEARATAEYRDSYDSTGAELATVSKDEATKACDAL
jgi:hypothetical protein